MPTTHFPRTMGLRPAQYEPSLKPWSNFAFKKSRVQELNLPEANYEFAA